VTPPGASRRIDAHQHFWALSRGDYGWLTPKLAPVYRDFGAADLRPHLERAGIAATILVQAAPTEAETRYLLALAESSGGLVAGVVGWVDMAAPDAPARIDALAASPTLRGIRPMIHDIADPDWMLDRRLTPAFRRLVEHGLVFDALVRPPHLPRLRRLIERHPDLRVVVDHGAKPEIAAGRIEPWANDIAAIARESRAYCKLSGLVTEAAPTWRPADLRPYVDHLLASFGADRLIWGSDWPVVNLAGGYDAWWDATQELLAGLGAGEREPILGANAARFYGIG
jgi:L-fuconolactonase